MIKNFKFILIMFGLLFVNTMTSQKFKSDVTKSKITIEGTSNLHNWNSVATEINSQLVLNGDGFQSLYVQVPVKSIKSKEKLMDTKTYEALNSNKYPTISFKALDITDFKNSDVVSGVVIGNLTINGVTKKVVFKVTGKKINENYCIFSGSTSIKMTDFGIKPPTALLGTLIVGDGIKLLFNIHMIR